MKKYFQKSFNKNQFVFLKILLVACCVTVAGLYTHSIAYAGSITPSDSPSNDMYTMEQVYQQLHSGTTTSSPSGSFIEPSSSPAPTMHTLSDVYNGFATDVAATSGTAPSSVLSGNTFFDTAGTTRGTTFGPVAGTMANNGSFALTCSATNQSVTAGYYTGGTLTGDVNLVTGNIKNGATIFGVSGSSKVLDTTAGTATNGEVLSGDICYSNGSTITGTIATGSNVTGSNGSLSFSIPTGYYSGNTCTASDTNLATGNIKSGTTIFGVAGSSKVLDTTSGTAVAANLISGKVAYSNGSTITGTMPDQTGLNVASTAQSQSSGVNYFTAAQGYYDGTAKVSATDAQVAALSASLTAGHVASGTTIFGVAGTGNLVTGTGTGSAAAAGQILTNYYAWGSTGSVIQGSVATGSNVTGSNSSLSFSIPTGYYSGNTCTASDTNLVAGNIDTGVSIFGVSGTLLANEFNGTSGSFTGGSQANGGADDYNNGSASPGNTYSTTWTTCNSGNSYCGTSDSGAAMKDNATGKIWSYPCNGSACATFSNSSPATYSWDNSGANNSSNTASQLCSGHAGWSLPHQKQLMQAYIDGSYGNLEGTGVARYYWSATTVSNSTSNAWYTNLSNGSTTNAGKTNALYVRCVR